MPVPLSPRATVTAPAMPGEGTEIGPFRLVRALGRGGFAPVWLAEEVYDGRRIRDVAIKLFLPPEGIARGSPDEARFCDQIVDEARALCRVEHPNVVRFYSLQRDLASGLVGLAMEHVAGPNLDTRLRVEGKLKGAEVIDIGAAVAWALSAVHDAGLVHRDVKPGNIIHGTSGYKLIDFGIVVEHARGAAAPLIGTPGYIAPECLDLGAPPSPGSDLFALGATLFKLRTGELPEGSQSAGDDALGQLIRALIDPDPGRRPRHADWVARELQRLREGKGISSIRPAGLEAASPSDPTPAEVPSGSARAPASLSTLRLAEATPDARRELRPHPALVGRDAAIAALDRAIEEAKQGAPRFALITGPLGIGRTRILEAVEARAGLAARRVIRARCSPERRGLLRPILRGIEAMPEDGRSDLGLVLDAIERALAPASLQGAEQAEGALEGVEDALVWASADEPLLLAIDDIQWGDAYTLDLLRLLVDRAEASGAGKILVVAAARHEPSSGAPLRALLGRVRGRVRPAVKHIELGPLSAEESAALLQAVTPIAPDLERAVVRGAGGVPFFLVHALLVWREKGAIAWRDGMWHAVEQRILGADVPGVADLVEARLGACFDPASAPGRAALRALSAIALYGGGLGGEIVFRVVGGDEAATESALEALVDAGMLTVSGERQEYGFAQEMVRQATLNLVRQRPWFYRLHRALLDAVAEGSGAAADAAFLATGYEKLGAADPARRWLARAMEGAMGAGLFAEGADLGDRLAALTESAEARAKLELDAVQALAWGRQFEEARRRLERLEARAVVIPSEGGRALDLRRRILLLEAARGLGKADARDEALIADADALGDPLIRCEARMALAGVLPEAEALALASAAVDLAAACGPAVEFTARTLRFDLNYHSSRRDLEQAKVDLTRVTAIARATSSTWRQILVEGNLVVVEAALGQVEAAIDRQRRLVEQTERLGMRCQLRLLSHNLSALLLRAGRDAEAAAVAARTADLAAEAGDPALRARALSVRADVLARTGDREEALASVDEAERIQRDRGDLLRALSLIRRAEILDLLGRGGEAIESARAARRFAEERKDRDFMLCAALWERLTLARRGEASAEELARAIEETRGAGVTLRPLTETLLGRAEAWLEGRIR